MYSYSIKLSLTVVGGGEADIESSLRDLLTLLILKIGLELS